MRLKQRIEIASSARKQLLHYLPDIERGMPMGYSALRQPIHTAIRGAVILVLIFQTFALAGPSKHPISESRAYEQPDPPLQSSQGAQASQPDRAAPPNSSAETAPIATQQSTGAAAGQQVIRTGANLVLVRVVVRDPAGNAVANLRAEDFQLFDEGFDKSATQTITAFTLERAGAVSSENPAAAAGGIAPAPSSPASTTPSSLRYLALFFDDTHLDADELARARKAAEKFIAQSLEPRDRAGIFDSSGKGMLDFTDDHGKLHDALQALRPRPAASVGTGSCPAFDEYQAELVARSEGEAMDAATQEVLHCFYNDDPNLLTQAHFYVTGQASSIVSMNRKQDENSLRELEELVGRMSSLSGPRNIVLVSPGFMANALESQVNALIDGALRAGVTVSALDARGLYTSASLADISDDSSAAYTSLQEAAAHAKSGVMADIAAGTGGVFFQNNNDLNRGFRVTSGLPETAYVLGFTPSSLQLDGRFHTIKVTLAVPGKFTVQARRGYFAERRSDDSATVAAVASAPAGPVTPVAAAPAPAASAPAASAACPAPCIAGMSSRDSARRTARGTAQGPTTNQLKKATPSLWNPPNVDAPIPSLSATMPCPLADVLKQAGARAEELVTNLQEFSARESMHAEMLNEFGSASGVETSDFDYLVFITKGVNGLLAVRESHTVTYGAATFDRSMTDSGLTVLALIFYPPYAGGYDMRCEGQVQYQGHTAWVVHFQQRKDKPNVTRSFETTTGHYTAALKGRAWIAADSFQVLHLETNLVNWVAGLHLKSEAISIDYGPVQFHIRPVILWLPQSAEVFSEFVPYSTGSSVAYMEHPEDRRYHARYTFTDFKLFSVGTGSN
jgi:VWFA-related protein